MTKADMVFHKIKTNIQEVMRNQIERAKYTFFFSPTEQYYIYKGKRIAVEEVHSMYPTDLKILSEKGENPNARNCF
jgi:predicted ATP-grasp superfamily ATP-dependent carboligase